MHLDSVFLGGSLHEIGSTKRAKPAGSIRGGYESRFVAMVRKNQQTTGMEGRRRELPKRLESTQSVDVTITNREGNRMLEFSWTYLAVAFAGGMAGAAYGALPIFCLCGLSAVIGAVITLTTGDTTFTTWVTWGPFLGPQVSFAGGVAAAAYAKSVGRLDSGRDIGSALMGLNAPDVIVVGGIFGMLGAYINWLFCQIPDIGTRPWTNTIALSVVAINVIARVMFGKSGLFGTVPREANRWAPSEGNGWLPWQSKPMQLLLIGIGVALPAAHLTKILVETMTKSTLFQNATAGMTIPEGGAAPEANPTFLVFGFAVISLAYLLYNTKIPVTHHVALSAEFVVVVTGDIGWGLAFGLMAVFLAELFAVMFMSYGDTHIDPPSVALAATFTIQSILHVTGVLDLRGVEPMVIAGAIAVVGYGFFAVLQKQPSPAESPLQVQVERE